MKKLLLVLAFLLPSFVNAQYSTPYNPANVKITGGTILGTTVSKVTLTAPASSATLTIADGKTATVSNSLTLAGTDSTVMTFPATSATIARTDAANTFSGTQAFGALTATTVNGNTLTTGSSTYTGTAGQAYTFPTTSATIARTDAANTFTGTQTFGATSATTVAASSTSALAGTVTVMPVGQTNPGSPGYGLNVIAADASSATISMDSAGVTGGTLVFRRAANTLAAPSAIGSGDTIGRISGRGYEASQYSGTAAAIDLLATQTWTNSAAGSKIVFSTVPNSSTTLTTGMTLGQDQSLAVVGTITATIASSGAAQSGYLCYNTVGGVFTYDGGATCLVSLEEYKDKSGDITGGDAIRDVMGLKPFWGKYKDGTPMHDHRQQPFLGAHQVESVDPRLAAYDEDGKLHGVRYQNLTAVLVAAVQRQQQEIRLLWLALAVTAMGCTLVIKFKR